MIESFHRIWSLVVKELIQLSRDKLLMGFVILGPLLELTLMGNLVGGGIENLSLAVIDMDRSSASRELVALLDQTDELNLQRYGDNVEQAREWMQRGEVSAIVVVPPDYAERLADPRQGAAVQVITDDSNFVADAVARAATEQVAAEVAQRVGEQFGASGGLPIDLRFVARFNPTLEDHSNAITSLLGLIIYQVTLVIAAQSFTRERELGTLEQLRITPLGQVELIVGKALPTMLVGLLDAMLMLGVIVVWFNVPVRGSLPLLLLLTVPFVLTQIGWGMLISLISNTQQQAVLFVFVLAMLEVACSGFIVPASDMPAVMQVVSTISSVQHYLVIMRGVLLRGTGLGALWVPMLALMGIAGGSMWLAWLRLRAGLDSDALKWRFQAAARRYRRWAAARKAARGSKQPAPRTAQEAGWSRESL